MPLSDILSCETSEVESAITAEEPYSIGTWYMAKNIGMIELCQLGVLLGVAEYDSLTDGFTLVGDPLEDGPWPQTIPGVLVDRLVAVTDEEIVAVCPQWASIEEFGGTAPADSLVSYLRGLRKFLSENDGSFFLVNSL